MSPLTRRVLSGFPQEIQALIRAHRFDGDDELVQNVALLLAQEHVCASAGADVIFSRARSLTRRQTQDPACWAAGFGVAEDIDADDVAQACTGRRGGERAALVREVAARDGVTLRRAQQRVAAQVERAAQGDLFAGVLV